MGASHQIQPPHTAGTGDRVRNPAGESLVGTEPETGRSGEATEVSRFGAHDLGAHGEQSLSKMRDAIAPLASAHGRATPAAEDEGTAECTGPALPLSPVTKSGVTAGERPGTFSLVMPLEGGGEVRFFAVHGRVDMQIRVGKQRSWLTTPVSDRQAREYGERLVMISDLAFSQRQAKGA